LTTELPFNHDDLIMMKIQEIFTNYPQTKDQVINPYLIAEVGVNHEGDFDLATRLIREAAEGGADAVKFQTYKAETLASKYSPAYWDTNKEPTESQYALFKKYDSFWKNEYEKLKTICDDNNIDFMSTPFDRESGDFLNDLMGVYKIASADITNKPFIEQIVSYGKPVLLSTGASNLKEIHRAVDWIRENADVDLALLHCILNYPTDYYNANLGMIRGLRNEFPDYVVGYSDHTLPGDMSVMETATLLGAQILEKHFTHDKTLPGNDHYHAMDKDDLVLFRARLKRTHEMLGAHEKDSIPSEKPAREHARRSLVAAVDIPTGTILTRKHLTWKRPAHGISPAEIDSVVGKTAKTDIAEDQLLFWDLLA
jgi:sialic acid synthase SpsE